MTARSTSPLRTASTAAPIARPPEAQAAESGKPPEIVEKMVEGKIKKFLREVTLLGQPFVKDPDQSVEKYLAKAGATVTAFERFEVGEGLEKRSENFAEEVMAQVRDSRS